MDTTTEALPQPTEEKYLPDPSDSIEWQSFEYELRPKNIDWFWAVGLVAVAAAVIAGIFGNFLFSVIIILAAFSMIMYGLRAPEVINCALTPDGVRVNHNLYPYDRLRAFWVRSEREPHELILHIKRNFLPHAHVLLNNLDPNIVRDYLLHYLPEEPHHLTLADAFEEYLGF